MSVTNSLKSVTIRGKQLTIPIIQGGMGVGISLGTLAGAVMKEGGMGVISAAHPGYRRADFRENPLQANCLALVEEVEKARRLSGGKGLLGVNVMAAATQFEAVVRCAVAAKVDVILSGAGLPLDLPLYGDEDIALGVIVSSKRAASLLCKAWDSRYHRIPDLVVVEGSEAGGHLGFTKEQLANQQVQSLADIVSDVLLVLAPYAAKYGKVIPVFAAGGVYTHEDIVSLIELGASGVQLGTRFIATNECDASMAFKQTILDATKEQIELVHSPAGFPGRAVVNSFVHRVRERGNVQIAHCLDCLKPCNPKDTPYCISEALIQSARGNVDFGLVFAGSNAYRVKEIVSVHALMEELIYGKEEER